MAIPRHGRRASTVDWTDACRRAGAAAADAVAGLARGDAEAGRPLGRGEGGDVTLAIDRAAEDAIFGVLESLDGSFVAVSEERGHVEFGDGGPRRVVIDPIDGSLNAKRGLPPHCVSIAVAGDDSMAVVDVAFVRDLYTSEEWWAERDGGAFLDGRRLGPLVDGDRVELLGVDSATPALVGAGIDGLAATGADRLRSLGSIALTMCQVAAGRLDAMVSLAPCRSVDAAAAQLIVREAGGAAAFPDAGDGALSAPLGLSMRSRVGAASGPEKLTRVVEQVFGRDPADTIGQCQG